MGSAEFPIVISDDDEEQLPVEPPVAAVPGAEDEQAAAAGHDDNGYKRPDWLPKGFEVQGYRDDDGTFRARSFICPVTGFEFSSKTEVLDYCSGGIQRAQAARNTLSDMTTLQGKYDWLSLPGWVLEIRAGGEDFSKMYKFYAHLPSGVRLQSKAEVLRYMDETELPECIDGACDTSTEDNIIAQLKFYIRSLPPGWVKETAFRKCRNGIRKDVFYTDPITKKVFRSLKNAEQYFASGEPVGARVPTMSVTDMYYFDRCTDMLPCLARRLTLEGTGEGQTSCSKKTRRAGKAKRKATTETAGSSKTPKPSRRP